MRIPRSRLRTIVRWMLITSAAAAGGCTANNASSDARAKLDAGNQAFQAHQYDTAIADANTVLAEHPSGPETAEAYYLRGRAVEDRVSPQTTPDSRARDLGEARADYEGALRSTPPPWLEARIHAALANIAYQQDDYPTALREWTTAYPNLDQADWKAWALYRIGLSQQRLGRFDEADQTFSQVQRLYAPAAGGEPAQRARQHQGVRGFYVQVGAYSRRNDADRAAAAVRAAGLPPQEADDHGLQAVRAGPVPSYAQAQSLKARLAGTFPGATIIP